MRVLLVHTRYQQRGGEDIAFDAEAELLEQCGHEVYRFESANAALHEMSKAKAAVVALWNERARARLRDEVKRIRPEVVHFHNTFPLFSPAAYYAVGGSAVVQTLHNYRLICPAAVLFRAGESCERCVGHFPWQGIVHGCYRHSRTATATVGAMVQVHRTAGTWKRVHAFVALTEHARTLFLRGGLPGDRVFVKPNFVHPDPGAGSHDEDYYLYVGRLEEQKGIQILLAAWQQMQGALRLRIVGDGPLAAEVKRAAAENPAIEYAGPQTRAQVIEYMSKARALIFASLSHENCPLTLLEAFATGLPVLASGTGNIAAFMAGGGGWTYAPGDASALAAAVRAVDTDAARRSAKSAEARQRWAREFTAEHSRQQVEAIYQTALQHAQET